MCTRQHISRSTQLLMMACCALSFCCGCRDDSAAIREIQAQAEVRLQAESGQDHLGDAFDLLSRLVELNPEQSRRQIAYHLNRWQEGKSFDDTPVSDLVGTISELLPGEQSAARIDRDQYVPADVDHLRNAYLFRRLFENTDREANDDPLLVDWFGELEEKIGSEPAAQLRTASRLFDWTIRNIAYEPLMPTDPAPPPPKMSSGMSFRGPGYRQTDYQTLWRGTGDALQRSGVFTQLCRQASIPAFLLAIQSSDSGRLNAWSVGVLVGSEIYLFEPRLGLHVPGPGLVGIATLSQARRDASVMRRLTVPGFFEDGLSRTDIQQSVAQLNVLPEAISPRMKNLESGLAGDRRMKVYVDVDSLAKQIDDVSGIAGVRLWDVPLLAELYQRDLEKASLRDPMLRSWYLSRWAILDMSRSLALGRWRHLQGQFDNDEENDIDGARSLYIAQRAPEFEIEDLTIDVELQKAYGVRREPGTAPEQYDRQILAAQQYIRLGKRLATYWISLIHYADGRYDNAETWLSRRVLDEQHVEPRLAPAARYNLARVLERLGEAERAVETYKTEGEPSEHGNRLRARLVARANKSASEPNESSPSSDASR